MNMAFDFLGTLSSTRLQDFRNFLEAQLLDIDEEINYLYVELNNLKQTLESFSEADAYFGGNALNSLYDIELNNIVRSPKQNDSESANLMAKVKKPFISTIKYKLEKNEYKMKKLLDVIEQTKESIDRKSIAKSQTIQLLNNIETLFVDDKSRFLFKTDEEMSNFSQGIVDVL